MKRYRQWSRISRYALLMAMLVVNSVAWMQAWALTHYSAMAPATAVPERLSLAVKVRTLAFGVRVPRPENTHSPRDLGLAFETQTISLAGDGLLETWVVDHEHPKGIVALFPSYAASKESLLQPARAFYDLGYTTMLVDFRGVGGSTGAETTLGVREADDVVATAHYLATRWPQLPIVLYGVSMGSTAIMRAVARSEIQPAALIVESPFDRLTHTTAHRFEAMDLPPFPATEVLLAWGSVQQGINAFHHNPVDDAAQIRCPVLLLAGANDPRVTEGETRAIFDRLGGPKQRMDVPNAGHELLLLAAPAQWQAAVMSFLATLSVA